MKFVTVAQPWYHYKLDQSIAEGEGDRHEQDEQEN